MKKIKKTYRLHQGAVEQIQAIKKQFEDDGFGYSDANIIEKAVSEYMDTVARVQRIKKAVEKEGGE